MGVLRCILDDPSTLQRPHRCNSRLTLVLLHCANNRCSQWGELLAGFFCTVAGSARRG